MTKILTSRRIHRRQPELILSLASGALMIPSVLMGYLLETIQLKSNGHSKANYFNGFNYVAAIYAGDIYAGDTGIGYYKPDGKYSIIWKNAGEIYYKNNPGVVYKYDAKH